jgi:hypothetical protein
VEFPLYHKAEECAMKTLTFSLVNVFGEKLSTIGTFEDVFKYKN